MKRYRYIAIVMMGLAYFGLPQLNGPGIEVNPNWPDIRIEWPGPLAHAQDLKAGDIDPQTGKKIKYWVAPMDPTYIRNEPGQSPMGMDLVPVYEEEEGGEKEPSSTVRIDPVTRQNMGLRLGAVQSKSLTRSIRAFGNITYNETALYAVNTKFNGWVEKLYVDFVGDQVEPGQPLFEIYSPELFTAQREYLLALEQQKGISKNASRSVREGNQRMLEAARTRLQFWDLSDAQIKEIETSRKIKKNLTIYSPARGVVVKKNIFEGHYVKAGMHQYEIADLSTVWVDVDIYEYELPWVRKGMPAEMELAYIPGERFAGEVLFIYPYVDPKTRAVKLRLTFDNPDMKLKPGMYANVYLSSRLPQDALVIPQEAVIDSGVRKIVFVAKGKGRFEPREVTLGVEGDNYDVEVREGLQAGEEIVVSGQFMLDSESRLQEAIQKMLAARQGSSDSSAGEEDLNMDDLSMDDMNMDDLTMDDLTMESE
ncbi:MAG: efflux RND transporter periplasmic adaptor subunit [Desulfobacterales bacterium]